MALRQMRAVTAKIYQQKSWVHAVKSSGLADALAKICHPSTHLELSQPHISQSFRNYSWKESLGEVLDRWTDKKQDDNMDVDQKVIKMSLKNSKLTYHI